MPAVSNQPTRALFIGRGPFSKTLQRVLAEVAPDTHITEVGKDGAETAVSHHPYDVLFLVCPPQAHARLLPLAWSRGKPTWVEKPFGSSAAEAAALVAAWEEWGKPPCYVDFPHLRLLEAERLGAAKQPHLVFAAVGGPRPNRPYMGRRWDWGSHVVSMALYLRAVETTWGQEGLVLTPEAWRLTPGAQRPFGGVPPPNGARRVEYHVTGGGDAVGIYPDKWLELPVNERPLAKAMNEILGLCLGAPSPTHPNWDPCFAAQVTRVLAALEACEGLPYYTLLSSGAPDGSE